MFQIVFFETHKIPLKVRPILLKMMDEYNIIVDIDQCDGKVIVSEVLKHSQGNRKTVDDTVAVSNEEASTLVSCKVMMVEEGLEEHNKVL